MNRTHLVILALLTATFACKTEEKATGPLPDGFVIEELFSPSKHGMGSWVALTTDQKGRVISSDQYGDLYRFELPDHGDTLRVEDIEKIPLNIGFAQGLLMVDNDLFVMVNRYTNEGDTLVSGLYKLSDTDGNDELDKMEQLLVLEGAGEHGPHGLVQGPDGLLYLVAGNHTLIPDSARYLFPDNFGEDNLLPVIKDPRGHANHIKPPGGWVARIDLEGKNLEVIAVGFRNAYDLAFNQNGDLFTFDSDMEWDMGTPWYRPIRICHVFPGADFGWRTGSGKFPDYYADSWPGVVEMGQGSPTGILFGGELDFPDEYRESIYALDWSFGTIYKTSLQERNDSYSGDHSEFFTQKSFPVTDVIAASGDMVFATGGRRLNSGIYRIYYKGPAGTKDLQVAGRFDETGESDLDRLWDELGSASRMTRYRSRIQLEGYPDQSWIDRIETETDPDIRIQALIALARITPSVDADQANGWLNTIDFSALTERQKLDYLRAQQLLLIRYAVSDPVKNEIVDQLSSHYPDASHDINRELLRILSVLGDSSAIDKTIALFYSNNDETEGFLTEDAIERSEQYGDIISLIRRNSPQTRLLGYLESLSVLQKGWSDDQREQYYTAFNTIFTSTGGMSYKGFAERILDRSLSSLDPEQRTYWRNVSGVELMRASDSDLAELPKPEGPGENWTLDKIRYVLEENQTGDINEGERMFQAALCNLCHIVDGVGAPIGPDLSNLGARFNTEDIARAIVLPHETVSDQYAKSIVVLKDSSSLTGRILRTENDTLLISLNPFDLNNLRKVPVAEVKSTRLSEFSTMPAGLINRLNGDEVRNLILYLSSLGSGESAQ